MVSVGRSNAPKRKAPDTFGGFLCAATDGGSTPCRAADATAVIETFDLTKQFGEVLAVHHLPPHILRRTLFGKKAK